jgi:hypothetical protein
VSLETRSARALVAGSQRRGIPLIAALIYTTSAEPASMF